MGRLRGRGGVSQRKYIFLPGKSRGSHDSLSKASKFPVNWDVFRGQIRRRLNLNDS